MKTKVTVETIAAQFVEDREFAIRLEQPGTAHQASVSLAKLFGLMIERKETGQPGEFANLETRQAILDAIAEQLGTEVAKTLEAALEAPQARSVVIEQPKQIAGGEAAASLREHRKKRTG